MSLAVWLGFFVAAILISVTPGPGAVISMSTGMRHGYRAGPAEHHTPAPEAAAEKV